MNNTKWSLLFSAVIVNSKWLQIDNITQLLVIYFTATVLLLTIATWIDELEERKRERKAAKLKRSRQFKTYKL